MFTFGQLTRSVFHEYTHAYDLVSYQLPGGQGLLEKTSPRLILSKKSDFDEFEFRGNSMMHFNTNLPQASFEARQADYDNSYNVKNLSGVEDI